MLSLLARPEPRASVTWSPLDPRWYADVVGARADAGAVVIPEAALSVAVVYRAVNVLAHALASIPLVVYEQLDDDGKEKARSHPQYDLLHDRPNRFMTSFRWRHLLMTQAVLWGNHYSEIIPGPGAIGQLVPLSPDTTRIVDQLADGRLVYVTRDVTLSGFGPERKLLQDDLVHVRGFSIDGKAGVPLTRLARNAIGLALAAERHGSLFMRRGARMSGFLSSPGAMPKKDREENEEAWQRMYGGTEGTGRTPLLTGGMTFQQVSANNKDSQWLEARAFQVEEILRFLGVPGVLVGYNDKTATYASAEQFFLSFVTHTLRPWASNVEQELNASVVIGSPRYFVEHRLEGLLRGDIKTRYSAHQLAILSGWKTRNEVRVEENYNRGPAPLDEFLEPLNMATAGEDPADGADGADAGAAAPRRAPTPPAQDAGGDPEQEARRERLGLIARRSVARLVRKEFAAIAGAPGRLGAAARYAGNPAGWGDWLAEFYGQHTERVSEDLAVPAALARQYCSGQVARFSDLARLGGPVEAAQAEAESVAALERLVSQLPTTEAAA